MKETKALPENFPFETKLKYKRENWYTDPQFGCAPNERSPKDLLEYGVVNLDKPANVNSHQLTSHLRVVFDVEKIGHGGTLDPDVSGILPIALEEATPITRVWLESDKEYVGVMRLHEEVERKELLSVLTEFEGLIYQFPPKASSVKRRVRKRKIYQLQLLEIRGKDVLVQVNCESGTYIRKLFHDIGEVLGTGAHMADLRRTKSGPFQENGTLKTVQDLLDAWHFYNEEKEERYLTEVFLPPETGVLHLSRVILDDGAIGAVTHGAPIYVPGIIAISPEVEEDTIVAAFSAKGELVALVTARKSAVEAVKQTEGQFSGKMRVLMERGIYPGAWK
ncbi:MAG: RNA-guided pseudouridylation complex pseudouridine synthase subunit Cbf5 [Candidatus Korarchaeota archaeon]|nr:RNA-guided pseudouridylation complex pseudouridine synthase subunit Cbf5 [Candidatus Korarchaeota archaeon]NIU82705.1 RNA-guided pseudouridylation complex pseudouridine synthase subunit Cbf5 [Candidatus Thorarchaeota archaeon]NIW13196.1 RNA-guided pseudouridylation complex pseudouridine synthase subunit Cbf5 [Candidatus Thorarchaeota archaeon]NIW51335.1 RNA-guided pseudouridylation complex pseudouridine synthase subunit Cbf5 [Candidatus Korarchaeota archaeon]